MTLRAQLVFGATSLALLASGCTHTGPVAFSATAADAPTTNRASDTDFDAMDHSIAQCKTVARNAGAGQCTKVRAYESCMKSKGYITVLGPENPQGCGEPDWEKDVRKWLQ